MDKTDTSIGFDDLNDDDLYSNSDNDMSDRRKRSPAEGSARLIRQSDNPTPATGPAAETDDVPGSPGGGGALRERVNGFFADVCLGLPDDFHFNPDTRIIVNVLSRQRICGPIRVTAIARRTDHSGFCVEVEFMDRFGKIKRAVFPHQDIVSGSGGFKSCLIDHGLPMFEGAGYLGEILRGWKGVGAGWRVDRAGWFRTPDGEDCFVQPDGRVHRLQKATGPAIVLFGAQQQHPPRGSLTGWKSDVGAMAAGNPALTFAISAALAGPLLRLAEIDTGVFNFVRPSVVGRAVLLSAALGCGTDPEALAPWSVTRTGLYRNSLAAQDGFLAFESFPLDPEPSQIKALLALADDAGSGKFVSSRDPDGGLRFRRVILSTSEEPLLQTLGRLRKRIPAALRARVVDIRLPDRTDFYADLHGSRDTATFERRLKSGVGRQYGYLLPAWLDRVTARRSEIEARLEHELPTRTAGIEVMLEEFGWDASFPSYQIARQFALVGIAGEIATGYGLLPWRRGAAQEAAQDMARRVCTGSPETVGSMSRTERFIAYIAQNRHRIVLMHPGQPAEADPGTFGWQDERYIYIDTRSLRDGVDDREVVAELVARQLLVPGNEARSRQYKVTKARFKDRQDRRVYRFDRVKLDAEMTRAEMGWSHRFLQDR